MRNHGFFRFIPKQLSGTPDAPTHDASGQTGKGRFRPPHTRSICYPCAQADNPALAMKYLLWIALCVLVYWILRKNRSDRAAAAQAAQKTRAAEKMVACAHCGINQPVSESIHVDNAYFCCREHQHAGARQKN